VQQQQQRGPYLPGMSRRGPWAILSILIAGRAGAQNWQSGTDIDLIKRAVAHRTARDADTLLSAWQAEAHGILRYVSELDHGDGPVERVIRLDELRVEVYGVSPNRSKQIILAWRDTTFLPNRIDYHRDHLGIVANDFGATIRLGQGEEVRDVPHPLSEAGLNVYQFALGDTLVLTTGKGQVRVVSIQVRPSHPDSAGTVGTLYLDIDRAALVRFRFTFTPASYRDRTVQEITVALDNSLQLNTRWLPWRQSILIRRGLPLLDFPVRTVIRADWTIDDYQFGARQPSTRFAGPFIDGPLSPQPGGTWNAPMAADLQGLPATDADVAAVERDASNALRGRALDGLPRFRFLAGGISDFVTVNRVEGVTPAFGVRAGLGHALIAHVHVGVGFSDHRVIGTLSLGGQTAQVHWSITGERLMRDVSDAPVISGIVNSLGTAISGDDHGDYTLVERLGAELHSTLGGVRAQLELGEEWSRSVATAFTPLAGTVAPNPELGAGASAVVRARFAQGDPHTAGWSVDVEGGEGALLWARLHAIGQGRIALSSGELQVAGEVGAGTAELPGYRSFVLGGRGTLLGVPFRALGGQRALRIELAWALPLALPTPQVPYARYARLATTIAPFVAAGIAGGDRADLPWRATGRVEPVAGLRLDLWGPLLRVAAGMALRTGQLSVAIDVHPDWWGLM
jgi:hypothetical protein